MALDLERTGVRKARALEQVRVHAPSK